MKSVGQAVLAMVVEVRNQFDANPRLRAVVKAHDIEDDDERAKVLAEFEENPPRPDYQSCVKISTDASLREMLPPGALVMLTPIFVGFLFGVEALAGVLAGALVSGVQMAIS